MTLRSGLFCMPRPVRGKERSGTGIFGSGRCKTVFRCRKLYFLQLSEEKGRGKRKMSAFLQADLIQKIAATVFVSMAPVVELRGGIPFGTALGLAPNVAMIAAVIGNLIPVPFIILFIRRIFQRMKRSQTLGRVAEYFEAKAEVRSEKVTRYRKFGLCIFVALSLIHI